MFTRNCKMIFFFGIFQVTIWTAKNQLKLLPQINRWDRQHLMSGLSENLTLTLASPTDGDTLKQIFEDFSHELNYIKEYDNSTENEAAIGNITYMLNNFDHYDQLAEIINQINGFFSLGKSCSFNSEIGKVKLLCKYFMILSPRYAFSLIGKVFYCTSKIFSSVGK